MNICHELGGRSRTPAHSTPDGAEVSGLAPDTHTYECTQANVPHMSVFIYTPK